MAFDTHGLYDTCTKDRSRDFIQSPGSERRHHSSGSNAAASRRRAERIRGIPALPHSKPLCQTQHDSVE